MAKGYYTASQIIDEALLGVQDDSRNGYLEAAMYFMRGYRDFQLFDAFQEKEKWVEINALNNTVQIPEDLVRFNEIGISISGEFFSFTEAQEMVRPSDALESGLLSDRNEGQTIDRTPSVGYGAKGQNVEYYYKFYEAERRIVLNRLAVDKTRFADRSEVLIKYISNEIDDLEKAKVSGDAANMLIAFIEWKMVASRPDKYDARYRMEKQQEFDRNETRYRTLLLPSVQEMLDAMYEQSGQNVRL